jgi:hypothetical protein
MTPQLAPIRKENALAFGCIEAAHGFSRVNRENDVARGIPVAFAAFSAFAMR